MRLTDITVRSLPAPPAGQKVYYDDMLPNFGCRVSQGGARTFIVRHGPDRNLITIGRYPIISLSEARQLARERLAEIILGRHRPRTARWDDAVKLFLAACKDKNRPRTVRDYTSRLKRHFKFGRRQLTEITPDDIEAKLRKIHAPSERSHALVIVKAFLSWCQKPPRRYIDRNPCDGMSPTKGPSRKRVLHQEEITVVLRAALYNGGQFGSIVALLLLTGQRRGETGCLRRSWFDFDQRTITFPASITKNGRSHTIPYGDMAARVLERIPDTGDLLFPASRDHVRGIPTTSYAGWAKDKRALDKKSGVTEWTLHDLRRTFATNLAKLKVLPHITEKLLNHTGGTISGVAAIYNRFEYMDEMRAAINAWEAYLTSLLTQISASQK
jgi:integrase